MFSKPLVSKYVCLPLVAAAFSVLLARPAAAQSAPDPRFVPREKSSPAARPLPPELRERHAASRCAMRRSGRLRSGIR